MYMNSRTKIVVIHMKELVIGGIVLFATIIAVAIIILSIIGGNDSSDTENNGNSTNNRSVDTNATASLSDTNQQATATNSSGNSTSITPANSTNTPTANTANNVITQHTYTPGVYTASVALDGNPVDVQVTVDKHNINCIELVQVSDAVTTMYPLIETNFNDIATRVIENGSTLNITVGSDNKYTSSLLLNAIQKALDKCTVN